MPDDNQSQSNDPANSERSDEWESDESESHESQESTDSGDNGEMPETVFGVGETFEVSRWLSEKRGETVKKGSGRRSLVTTSSKQGRYIRYAFPSGDNLSDIAFGATLRAASTRQRVEDVGGMAVIISKSDIRVKVRERRTGNAIVFVVDASGSMGAKRQMSAVKGAILSLLNDAYQKRDRVGLIAFRKDSAELLLGITRSIDIAEKKLAVLPTGGSTPLAAGIDKAFEIVKAAKARDKDLLPVIVLVTDGRATYSERDADAFSDALRAASRVGSSMIKSVIIDTDRNFVRLNLAEKLALAMNADRYHIEDIHAGSVLAAVSLSLN